MKKLFYFLPSLLVLVQCARQSQPQGGPKDTEDPKLLASVPANGQKNYKGKTIALLFDEYVKLKDPQEEIVIIPALGSKTKYIAKRNTIIITPEKNWKDSTTYSVSFRGAVQDINESNTSEDLHLAFSTGSIIDSLQINGSITELFKDKVPEKITIALYQSDTFDIFKHKPFYFTKTNKRGKFSLQNLKAGKYFIYAFEDRNKNFKADSKSERFGFLVNEVSIPENKDSLHINLIRVDARPIKVTSVRNTNSISTIRYNKPLAKVSLKTDTTKIVYSYGDTQSEIIVYKNFDPKDSLKISITAYDSVQQQLDTTVFIKYTDNKKIEEKFKQNEWQTTYDPETKIFQTKSGINKLLKGINYDSIYIQIDTANFQSIKPENLKFDTLTKSVEIKATLQLQERENMPHPVLLFGKGAFTSIDNDSTKSKEVKINLVKPTETGMLSIELNTNEQHFTVLLLDNNGKLVQSIRDKKKHIFKYLTPAEYKIVVIVDSNDNQKWDPGSFSKKIEPENVILYKNTENKSVIPIRANWEVGPLVITF